MTRPQSRPGPSTRPGPAISVFGGQQRFGQRTGASPATSLPRRFSVQSAVPVTTPSSADRFQTAFTASTPRTTPPPPPPTRPRPSAVVLPEITTTRRPPAAAAALRARDREQPSPAIVNTAPARPRTEQPRSLNIFDNKARVENSFDQAPQLLSNFNQKQSGVRVSEKSFGVNQQFLGSKQQQQQQTQFFSDEVNNSAAKSFRDFKFESLPTRFSSPSPQQSSDAFYWGPPSQTINMRDGSYTIITVLS